MDDLTNSTPSSDPSATPSAPEATQGTVQPDSDATQSAPAEETFTSVDVKTLPPQLQSVYKNMLKDYKEKTTKISETIKSEVARAQEAYKSKAELYDQIATQEEFVKQWNEYVQKSQNQGQSPQSPTDPVLQQMKQQLDEVNQKLQLNELSQVTEAFADAVNEKGEKIHPDFDTLNELTIGELVDGDKKDPYSLLRACVELAPYQNPQEKLAHGYKMAKSIRDQIFEEGRKAGMGRVQQKINNGTQAPARSSGDVMTTTDKIPKNAREALEMARKGIVVSR